MKEHRFLLWALLAAGLLGVALGILRDADWHLILPSLAIVLVSAGVILGEFLADRFEWRKRSKASTSALNDGEDEDIEEPKERFFTGRLAKEDGFYHDYFTPRLATMFAQHPREELPLVVGIFGPWGSGKTHFMRSLQRSMDGPASPAPLVKTVWYNPWRYERRQDVGLGLLFCIAAEIEKQPSLSERSVKVAQSLMKSFGSAFLSFIDNTAPLPVDLKSAVPDAIRAGLVGSGPSYQSEVDAVLESYRDLVSDWVGEEDRAVVFIDDLDRCLPDQSLRVLEALHLFLADVPCVFVLGADKAAIEASVEQRYGSAVLDGRQYLDKIVDIPFDVPPVRRDFLETRYQHEMEELGLDDEWAKDTMATALGGNPRAYERLFNEFRVVTRFGAFSGQSYWRAGLVVSILRVRYPSLYDLVRRDPSAFQRFMLALDGNPSEWQLRSRLQATGSDQFAGFTGPTDPARLFLRSLDETMREVLTTGNYVEEVMLLDD